MYPSGRPARFTTSNYETKRLRRNLESHPPTIIKQHAQSKPFIFLREEMEAFAEEKLRAVKDIDKKKDFLDII
jgi:hypothetical protein